MLCLFVYHVLGELVTGEYLSQCQFLWEVSAHCYAHGVKLNLFLDVHDNVSASECFFAANGMSPYWPTFFLHYLLLL